MKQSSLCKQYVKERGAYKTNFRHPFCCLRVSATCMPRLYSSCHFVVCSFELTNPASLVFVLRAHPNEAYTTCSSILAQLGETIPDTVTVEMVGGIIPETLRMYSNVYGDDWLGKEMEDTNLCSIVKFYSAIADAAFFCKPAHVVGYFVCKMVQMSLRNGVCQYTPLALMQLSTIVIRINNAARVQ